MSVTCSWLSKLDVIKELIVDRSPKMRPGTEEMASCYVYATWINTGAIMCAEAGGHHRPNHHANLALQMFRWAGVAGWGVAGGKGVSCR